MTEAADPLPGAIAIVGMACRFPGARTVEEFRRNLEQGVESITAFSDEELLRAGIDRALLANPAYVKAAPLLEDADRFDAAFFEYSPREAAIMDPQQRLFLECAWEALEDAGHAGDAAGSLTGVFSGAGGIMSTYLLSDTHFTPELTGTTASLQHVGNDKDYLSTRVSYKLDLRGPSLTVQTACSTSLVAVHLACQSLLTRECDMALAGGTTVRVPQRTGYLFKDGNVFSRDGHCRAFDADATGTVFGSGIGVVVLKRLEDARRDGDVVRAVIRATALSNDGSARKTSYWAPHAEGQAEAMRRALSIAGVDPATIGYVEAHGTATRKGDPTEIRALAQAFGPMAPGSCAVGSVKSNIGHPESAAGIAGLIKTVLSLEHKVLFPSLHYRRPNPEIDVPHGFFVNATLAPWEPGSAPRRAAVNSLGIGGTNAFAILEEAPPRRPAPPAPDRPCRVLALSAKSPEALDALAQRFGAHLAERPGLAFADVCHSANTGRAHFDHRLAIVAASTAEAARLLAAGAPAEGVRRGRRDAARPPRVAFLFTGQGSQYVNMARDLYETDATFRTAFDQCAGALSPALARPLADVLFGMEAGASPVDQTSYTQPALFAIEYALAALWRSWGVEPAVLVGHSVGEIVAACVAGVFGLNDALRLTAARARLMQALPAGGGMAAVRCDAARVAGAIGPFRDRLSIAAINGPQDVVVSGQLDALDTLAAGFERDGVTVTRLKVSHAFHSPLMDPMLEDFAQVARTVTFAPPGIPLVSNLTGRLATSEIATPEYWVRHVRESVRFADGIAAASATGLDAYLEIGPAPVLIGLARLSAPAGSGTWLASLRPGRPDWVQMQESLAALYAGGVRIDWSAVDRDRTRPRVPLPTYPFQRERYWIDPPPAPTRAATDAEPSLLGRRLRLPGSTDVRFEACWTPKAPAYLDDHRIFGTVVVPGASHVAMVLSAMTATTRQDACVLEDVVFPQALTLGDEEARTAQLVLKPDEGTGSAFAVMTLPAGADEHGANAWVVHATGRATAGQRATAASRARLRDWQARCTRPAAGAQFYDRFWSAGYHLRGAFRWIAEVWAGEGEILCEMQWPDLPDDPVDYPLYPSLIDACFQCVFGDRASERLTEGAVYVPFSVRRLEFHGSPQPGVRLWAHVSMSAAEARSVDADIMLCDDSGRVIASIEGCQLREVRRQALLPDAGRDLTDALYEVEWQPAALGPVTPVEPGGPRGWLVFADAGSPAGAELVERLRGQGQTCVRVDAGTRFARLAPDRYEIDAASPEEMRRVLADTATAAGTACRGIVHLWTLDAPPMDDPSGGPARDRALASVLHLVQAAATVEWTATPRLWLVTRGAQPVDAQPAALALQQAPVWGLGRVIALEHPELSCVRVDLDPAAAQDESPLFDEVWRPGHDDQIAYRRGRRYAARLVRSSVPADRTGAGRTDAPGLEPFQIRLSSYGQFDHLVRQPMARRAPGRGEVEIRVHAAGLNFRDVLNALGLLEAHYAAHLGITSAADMTFGFECAGTIAAVGDGVTGFAVGDEVIAVGSHEAMATFVTLSAGFVAPRPAGMSLEEAATLPLAFLTACHALEGLAAIRPGDRVLVHAAAGGVGQACVQWCQRVGAEVFATASPSKWEALTRSGVAHVFSSRTPDFAASIHAATGGAGVDVVVNSLSGPFVDESFKALRPGGRFVELGKRDVWSDAQARERRPDVAYFPFDLMEISRRDPAAFAAMLRALADRLRAGTFTPLPRTVFQASNVVAAFRYMAEARHVGKIVIAFPGAAADGASTATAIRPDGTYLITGGLGALGLAVAERLVEEGARHLVVTSRRPPNDDARAALARLEQRGARVAALDADVSDAAAVARLLEVVRDGRPPLRGLVHAAGVLDDGVLIQQTRERFRTVLAPKVEGAWHLHTGTLDDPLDFFVCFSSVASLVGNAGQGNYAAANAFMDALAHARRALGLPALSINWGPWGEVGMAADGTGTRRRRLEEQGFRPIAPEQGLRALSRLLQAPVAQIGVLPIDWTEFLRAGRAGQTFFEKVAPRTAPAPAKASNLRAELAEAADPRDLLARHVRSVVGQVLGMRDTQGLDPRARLFDLGLESLMAVEMRGRFEESLACPLRPTLVFDYPTIEALVDHLAGKVSESRAPAPPPAALAGPAAGAPSALDEEAIAEELARELSAITKTRE